MKNYNILLLINVFFVFNVICMDMDNDYEERKRLGEMTPMQKYCYFAKQNFRYSSSSNGYPVSGMFENEILLAQAGRKQIEEEEKKRIELEQAGMKQLKKDPEKK